MTTRRTLDTAWQWPPTLHDYAIPDTWPGHLVGYVIEDQGWYWTGAYGEEAWSLNPRRALVSVSPWDLGGHTKLPRGRCVEVLLETEVTMLPLRHWPRQIQEASH